MYICMHVLCTYVCVFAFMHTCMYLCMHVRMYVHMYIHNYNTVKGERFAGLNFRVFHGFQEHCESFPVNINFIIQASYDGIVLVL